MNDLLDKIHTLASIIPELDDLDEIQAYLYEMETGIYDYMDEEETPKLRLVR